MDNWVHIDKRLPESNRMILLYAPLNYHTSGGITYGFYDTYVGRFLHTGSSIGKQYEEVSDQRNKRSEQLNTAVTHWMPLPEPPEQS